MTNEYLTELYNFSLPKELIAQQPTQNRDNSKLFVYYKDKDKVEHFMFKDIVDILDNNYFIVLNNTKVEPRRVNFKKPTGGVVPLLITHFEDGKIKALPYKKINTTKLFTQDGLCVEIVDRDKNTNELVIKGNFTKEYIQNMISNYGLPPLPPYIKRKPNDKLFLTDYERYQTVYAKVTGAIAAPTAGLHFTENVLNKLQQKGIKILYITLNIGLSTFKPVKTKLITEHKMLPEHAIVTEDTAKEINNLLRSGKKLLCVGTTTVRTLEYLMTKYNKIVPYNDNVDLYIYPGYNFKITQAILTNFHLPKSTNLILLSAFIGREKLFKLYKIAVEKNYKFYSYGDAMLII